MPSICSSQVYQIKSVEAHDEKNSGNYLQKWCLKKLNMTGYYSCWIKFPKEERCNRIAFTMRARHPRNHIIDGKGALISTIISIR
jgi:hypothetical protein